MIRKAIPLVVAAIMAAIGLYLAYAATIGSMKPLSPNEERTTWVILILIVPAAIFIPVRYILDGLLEEREMRRRNNGAEGDP